jgi:hypothetical protein
MQQRHSHQDVIKASALFFLHHSSMQVYKFQNGNAVAALRESTMGTLYILKSNRGQIARDLHKGPVKTTQDVME